MVRTVDDLHCQEFNWLASFKIMHTYIYTLYMRAYIIFIFYFRVFIKQILTEYLLCVRHYA